jgi:hypothetical protein
MTDQRDLEAIDRWAEWASREATKITRDDWNRLVAPWVEIEVDDMGEVFAGLSDGELAWVLHSAITNIDNIDDKSWAVRVEMTRLHRLVTDEVRRRVLGERRAGP